MDVAGSEEDETVQLPDDLLERILLSVPFPYIFKVRMLSKRWNEKFEKIARTACNDWPSFCPTFLDVERNSFLGYDRARGKWLKMKLNPVQKTLKCLRKHLDRTSELRPSVPCDVDGVLLCEVDDTESRIRIINLLTGGTRTVPYPADFHKEDENTEDCSFYSSVIIPVEADKYKVVLYGIVKDSEGLHRFERLVFDSSSMSWSFRSSAAYFDCDCRFYAYLDGHMYFLCSTVGLWDGVSLLVGSVGFEDEDLQISRREIPLDVERVILNGVLRCGSRIIVFVVMEEQGVAVAQLYEVNTHTLKLSQLSVGLLGEITGGVSASIFPPSVMAHRDGIFFYGLSSLYSYDLESDVWNTHRIEFPEEYREVGARVCSVAFEPGLNTFVVP